jgi:hypothetical protein
VLAATDGAAAAAEEAGAGLEAAEGESLTIAQPSSPAPGAEGEAPNAPARAALTNDAATTKVARIKLAARLGLFEAPLLFMLHDTPFVEQFAQV